MVNGEPRICFANVYENNYFDHVLNEQEKSFGVEKYIITHCNNVTEFIETHKNYHCDSILKWFIHDAARLGIDFAVQHYSEYKNFNHDWEDDTEINAKIESIRKILIKKKLNNNLKEH